MIYIEQLYHKGSIWLINGTITYTILMLKSCQYICILQIGGVVKPIPVWLLVRLTIKLCQLLHGPI